MKLLSHKALIVATITFLNIPSAYGNDASKVAKQLSLKLDKLGSFEANYVATRSKDNARLHIRVMVNRKDKFSVIKINDVSKKNGSRIAMVFNYKNDMRQMMIYPKNLRASYFSSDMILNDPYNILTMLMMSMYKVKTGDDFHMYFGDYAPTVDIKFDKKNFQAYLGVNINQKRIMASWLSKNFFAQANKIIAGKDFYKIHTNDRRIVKISSLTGLLLRQDYYSLGKKTKPVKTMVLTSFTQNENPPTFNEVFPYASRLKTSRNGNPEFVKSVIGIVYSSMSTFFKKQNNLAQFLEKNKFKVERQSIKLMKNLLINHMRYNRAIRKVALSDMNLILKPAYRKRRNKKITFEEFCKNLLENKLRKNTPLFKSLSLTLLGRQNASFAKPGQFLRFFSIIHQSEVKPLALAIKAFHNQYKSNFSMAYWQALLTIISK